MSCTNPVYALDLGVKENGKRNIKILPKRVDLSSMAQVEARFGHGQIIPLPCGKCLACRKSKAREWAVRCVLEATEYEDNCFITLTYDDKFYFNYREKFKEDLINFFKRVRKDFEFRYFACCERGTEKGRYHFHALLFGVDLTKKQLEKYWKFGFVDSGSLTAGSCFYVSQYVDKKIFQTEDFGFITMSTHPGLGYGYFKKHMDVVKYGQVHGSFGANKTPRYFEKLYSVLNDSDLSEFKDDRLSKAKAKQLHEMLVHGLDRVEKLYDYQAEIDLNEFKHKKRRADL